MKKALGVPVNNLGFDAELLLRINSTRASLVQLGVSDLDGINVTNITEWPTFQSTVLQDNVKHYMLIKVKQGFDPVPSETIASSLRDEANVLEGRIAHEVEVQNV
jgi:hypothetical protein